MKVIKKKVLFSWSGGKDSALALYRLLKNNSHEVIALITTVTEDYGRISMHGIRRCLLNAQVKSINLPLKEVIITKKATNEEYDRQMRVVLTELKEQEGSFCVAFGDIFLEDVRKYREERLARLDLEGIFPLWQKDTMAVAREFLDLGFKAVIKCVDSRVLDKEFVGRDYDEQFLADLPSNVDPCGENGEFHSFVYEGPIFDVKIPFLKGKIVLREKRFYFCDLVEA